jgi:hypothetical protein
LQIFCSDVHALMPPHVTETIPQNGGILEGNIFIIKGYTLNYDDDEPIVTDLTSDPQIEVLNTIAP